MDFLMGGQGWQFSFQVDWMQRRKKNLRDFYATLSEKDQRRFAAIEARQLGYGGIQYVAEGVEVLSPNDRTRSRRVGRFAERSGGGPGPSARRRSKKKLAPGTQAEQNLKSVLQVRTAGDPDDESIVFTDLTPERMSETLDTLGTPVCGDTIRQWMDEQDLKLRKISKAVAGGSTPDRDAQFVKIAELIQAYEAAGNPYFSVDTKAKEHLGQLFRSGRVRSSAAFQAFDHDFPSWAEGRDHSPRNLRPGSQLRPYQYRLVSRHQPVCLRQPALVLEPHRQAVLSGREFDSAALRLRRQQCGE
jgi:hypothetical protein